MIPPERLWLRARQSLARRLGVDLTHSQQRYFQALRQAAPAGGKWLDVGCGHQIVPDWAAAGQDQRALAARTGMFVGADLDPSIREHELLRLGVFASVEHLPFVDKTFDTVSANMVVEHLQDPGASFREIRRVLKPGGKFIFHTPNYRFYGIAIASWIPDALKTRVIRLLERRDEKDIFHTYYQANTVEQAESILRAAGFGGVQTDTTAATGMFQFLGPAGVVEIPILKALIWSGLSAGRATLIVVATN
jgi:ubiquinone/menaquinone biosynthesis C-methylase UbiE